MLIRCHQKSRQLDNKVFSHFISLYFFHIIAFYILGSTVYLQTGVKSKKKKKNNYAAMSDCDGMVLVDLKNDCSVLLTDNINFMVKHLTSILIGMFFTGGSATVYRVQSSPNVLMSVKMVYIIHNGLHTCQL